MCTLVILRRPESDWPVILGANRDEMIARPWLPPARHWPDRPEIVAGMDELAGGSWLGLNDHGVVAGILNRQGSLGPAPGQRSRGELVLEALDHADAAEAAKALRQIEPSAYRPFNLILADSRDAFWLRHADPEGKKPVELRPIPEGLAMIAATDLDDPELPRLRRYRPRFLAASAPDPARGDWSDWEKLLDDNIPDPEQGPLSALRFVTDRGFGTVSSSLIALPSVNRPELKPVFRFASRLPTASPWADLPR